MRVKIMHNEQATFEAAMAYIKDHEVDCDLWMGDTVSPSLSVLRALMIADREDIPKR